MGNVEILELVKVGSIGVGVIIAIWMIISWQKSGNIEPENVYLAEIDEPKEKKVPITRMRKADLILLGNKFNVIVDNSMTRKEIIDTIKLNRTN